MESEERLSLLFSALADPTRRAILARLSRGPSSVGDLAAPFDMSAPAISRHLKVLEKAGLISRTTKAQWRTIDMDAEPLDEVTAWIDKQKREWNLRFDALDAHLETMKQEHHHDHHEKEKNDDHP
ncbi:MAG: metalloregulator ArsR/SmtB family transcription factor [Corynebacterium sp.]|uniref:ArsR/SmtB family transcription factor n=1 Tax=Corynebacterium TaxID=1716 RepID=UPI002647BCB6|nr:metalloregulator ArsR/SmtB family transcription factor [Corynebacterium sp.]MDN5722582.1 metalloregulator ArsR/SmtB family transcription factor [Corynebacterium sp.]MDN6282636.1 metalloregulator ArsR/SmtB family transcription factor [Corynebacterium sp.]MDN6306352.1 metalloregulator ArsR/SmtB family transcription factor [Corynebacterium sp.]MDN6353554.1 metalloregulator ArsR/SmtB family transcription factor [Corynebacterium sp.]MDN6367082.1 metalloregulator ArsR/SmtB family transcription fa